MKPSSAFLTLALACTACGGDEDKSPATPQKLAITADWFGGSLSYIDLAALEAGKSTRAEIVTRTIPVENTDLGPLALELTPDKKKLLVSVSVGFFAIPGSGALIGESGLPTGAGSLRIFDVESGEQEAEILTGDGPMGAVVTPDSKRAFVAHFGSGDIAILDLTRNTVEKRVAIGTFPEEIALDDTGSVGVVGFSTAGSVKTFGTSDLEGSLSKEVALAGDSAGVAFFPGTKTAFVVQAPNPLSVSAGYTLIDVSEPSAPRVLEDVRTPALDVAYPAIAAPDRGTVIVPITRGGRLYVEEYTLAGEAVTVTKSITVTDANLLAVLGVGYDGAGNVLSALASEHALAITNLDSGESRIIPWEQTRPGPSDVTVR